MEESAAGNSTMESAESPLAHIRGILDDDTVVLSFHLSKTSSWVWAIDRKRVDAFALPPVLAIQSEIAGLTQALREGNPASARELGQKLYRDLFGGVPQAFLGRKHWRLELDGPLYELPFAALVTGEDSRGPIYLIESADLESIPGALLAKRAFIPRDGEFLGVGDPVYNLTDERYHGKRGKPALSLARLPNTSTELQACARAWNSPGTTASIASWQPPASF